MVAGEGQGPNLKDLIEQVLSDREQQKEDRKKISGMAEDVKLIKGMICDSQGNCRLPTAEDIERIAKKEVGVDGVRREIENLWPNLSDEEKARQPVIPKDAHTTMLKIITEAPESRKGLNKAVTKRLEREEWSELMESNPELLENITQALACTTPECRERYNQLIDKAKSQLKGEKGKSWLEK